MPQGAEQSARSVGSFQIQQLKLAYVAFDRLVRNPEQAFGPISANIQIPESTTRPQG